MQFLQHKELPGRGTYLKLSDSVYTTFHTEPGNREVAEIVKSLVPFTIILVKRASKNGSKLLLDEVEVLDGKQPAL